MLSLEEVKAYGPQYKTVPVSRRMYAISGRLSR